VAVVGKLTIHVLIVVFFWVQKEKENKEIISKIKFH
jgi:hypothetical protein